jgi:heat shock protein HslJ
MTRQAIDSLPRRYVSASAAAGRRDGMTYVIPKAASLAAFLLMLCGIMCAVDIAVSMQPDWDRVVLFEASAVEPSLLAEHLTGIEWRVTELSGHPVARRPNGEQPFIFFDQAKRQVTGYAGCNRFFGGYEMNGGTLKFGPIAGTKRACPDLEEGLETEFFKTLDATRGWRIVEGSLQLLNDGLVLARFQKMPEGHKSTQCAAGRTRRPMTGSMMYDGNGMMRRQHQPNGLLEGHIQADTHVGIFY